MEQKEGAQSTKVQGRWRNLWLLAFASLIDGVEGGILGTLFTLMRGALGLRLRSTIQLCAQ